MKVALFGAGRIGKVHAASIRMDPRTQLVAVTDVVTVFTRVDRRGYEVPTAFSPNDDGVNDRWVLRATPSVRRVRSARVFDRWGGQLYFRTDVPLDDEEAGWDGRVGGEALDVGVYVYAVEVEFVDGSTRVLAGELNLLR